jgi:hypothetical protein
VESFILKTGAWQMTRIKVYLEIGKKKVFASGLDWPGWSRAGRNEDQALQALLDYGACYAQVLNNGGIGFKPPKELSRLEVIDHLPGTSTTDFGAPAVIPDADREPFELKDLEFSKRLLQSCWSAFDNAVQAAAGSELRKGPRGGGRDVDKIVSHVLEADRGYLARIAWKHKVDQHISFSEQLSSIRQDIFDALEIAADEGLPDRGPRGGKNWPARYFVRRSAWHILDHAWEIEDRNI